VSEAEASPASPPSLVTVDGPAGSGKTTLGRRLAAALGVPLIDTGLFYRGVMAAAVAARLDASDERAAADLAARTVIEVNTDPTAPEDASTLRVDGRVADAVARDPANATLLAGLSRIPGVRAALLERQRALAANGAVAVGRDCGTVVFPWAPVKLFLEASDHVRAGRRAAQLRQSGTRVDEAALHAEVAGRDRVDRARAVAPLRPAADAHIIDTGVTGIEEMVQVALRLCRERGLAVVGE